MCDRVHNYGAIECELGCDTLTNKLSHDSTKNCHTILEMYRTIISSAKLKKTLRTSKNTEKNMNKEAK